MAVPLPTGSEAGSVVSSLTVSSPSDTSGASYYKARRWLDSRAVSDASADDPIGLLQDLLLKGRPAARESLERVRDARAAAPGPDAEALRRAYLDLLKLSLCDLTGTTTVSVGSLPGGGTASRVLRDDQLRLRAAGMDWPLQGLTMTGLPRLDDLQACVETVVRDGVEGDLIVAGAWRGGASILMRAALDSLGASGRTVFVADSFQGFPKGQEQDPHTDLSGYDFLAVPQDEVRASFARLGLDRGVRFVPGYFEDTLPTLADGSWAIVRLDGDTYGATWTALQALYPGLSVGGHLIVDDYGAIEECGRAVDEFRAHNGIDEPLEKVDWTCVRWRRESDAAIAPRPAEIATAGANGTPPAETEARIAGRDVPTVRELQLADEVERLRERLADAEAKVGRLEGSPVQAAAAWLGRKRHRRA
jgi:O-methyltransferase